MERLIIGTADGASIDVWRSRGDGTPDDAPAVVLCHGFIQNRLAFQSELSGGRSLLAHLRSLGLVVYVVELRGRGRGRPADGLHIYTEVDASAVIHSVAARHRSVSFIGHSMGGIVGTLLPETTRDRLDAVVTIGAPLFPGTPELHRLLRPARAVRAARFAHARGFRFEGKRWSGLLYAMRRVLDEPRVPAPVRIWAPGALDERTLAFTLQQSFANDSWAVFADLLELVVTDADRAGEVPAGQRLRRFDRPLLVIAGDADDLAPPSGARPLYERAGSTHKSYLEVGAAQGTRAGHIDLLIGDDAPALVWAPIADFLRRHQPGLLPR